MEDFKENINDKTPSLKVNLMNTTIHYLQKIGGKKNINSIKQFINIVKKLTEDGNSEVFIYIYLY